MRAKPSLGRYIADRLRSHGISVTADEIMLTSGSHQGIDHVLRMIAAPGRAIALESPTYDRVIPLVAFHGLRPLAIPMRPEGMDLAVLAEHLAREAPALVYTMPNFQNPTGTCTGQAHREALLSLCEEHRVPILEDGFEEEMKYSGRVILPIKSMDSHHLVIYCRTFSKVLFPGVRVGWVAAHRECIEHLAAIRRFTDLSPSLVMHAAVHEFCRRGHYDGHVSKMHRAYRRRMKAVLESLRRRISPQWAEWIEPTGGYLVWLELKGARAPDRAWGDIFAAHGVRVARGPQFFAANNSRPSMRLSISALNEDEIADGVRRLAAALEEICAC